MNYTIDQLADDFYRDLNLPTTVELGSIRLWARSNIGYLNNVLGSSYTIDETTSNISPLLNDEVKAIYKKLYEVYYYGKIVRENLTSSSFEAVLEVSDDAGRVRLANKNEIAKTYVDLKIAEQKTLDDLINNYKLNVNMTPLSVDGKDGDYDTGITDDSV